MSDFQKDDDKLATAGLDIEARFAKTVAEDYEVALRAVVGRHRRFFRYLQKYKADNGSERRPIGLSRASSPIISEAVNVIIADILDKEFHTDLNIDTIGREMSDDHAAAAIRNMIKYQAYVGGLKSKSAELAFSTVLYGMGPAKVFYEEQYVRASSQVPIYFRGISTPVGYRREMRDQLKYRGPVVSPIDIFDWLPHPDKTSIDDAMPNMHRFYPSPSHLIDYAKQGRYHNIDRVLTAIEEKRIAHEPSADEMKEKRRKLMGVKFDRTMFATSPECIEWQGWFDINDDGIDEFCIGTVARIEDERNNQPFLTMRLGECGYDSQQSNYVCGRLFRIPGEFWAIGIAEMVENDEDTATGLLRAMLDSYNRVARPRTIVVADHIVDETELQLPWGVVHVEANELGTAVVQELQPGSIGQDGYNLFQWIQTNSKARSGVGEMMAGRVPGQKTTATVGTYAFNQASTRFKNMLWFFEDSCILPICERFHAINQQYIDKDYAIFVLGDQGKYWATVSPAQIAGKVNFIALGSTKEVDRQVNIEQLMRLIQIFGAHPMLAAAIPLLAVNIAEEFRMRNLEQIKVAVGYNQMLAQIMQAAQMGITPQQMLAMQGIQYQTSPSGGNSQPYGGIQEQTPTNQEELQAKTGQRMTANFPVAR